MTAAFNVRTGQNSKQHNDMKNLADSLKGVLID